jgi:hypothetical protein
LAKKYTIIVDFLQIKKDIDRNKKILKDIGANSIIPIYRLENLPPPFFLDIPSMIYGIPGITHYTLQYATPG